MTMYLPNRVIRPIGVEPAEFLDTPDVVPAPDPPSETIDVGDDDETSAR